jgi:hypothetical protein
MTATPVPGGVERDVVRPANQPGAAGDRANDGFLPLTRNASPVKGSNFGPGGDRRGGSANLAGQPSPVTPPNHVFQVGMSSEE